MIRELILALTLAVWESQTKTLCVYSILYAPSTARFLKWPSFIFLSKSTWRSQTSCNNMFGTLKVCQIFWSIFWIAQVWNCQCSSTSWLFWIILTSQAPRTSACVIVLYKNVSVGPNSGPIKSGLLNAANCQETPQRFCCFRITCGAF